MISHDYKCIFVHIPKTAGSSIEQKLGLFDKLDWGVQDHRTISEMEPKPKTEYYKNIINHLYSIQPRTAIKEFLELMNLSLSHKQYNDYFKFSFVRNPWSRAFSWYKNVMRDERQRMAKGIQHDISFKDFIIKYDDQWALKSQLFWLQNSKGKIPFDFIGRYENLTSDFGYVCDQLGIKDKSLPYLLKADNPDYMLSYDGELVDLLNKRYKEEIDIFGFKFGD
jgi:hypothetical protein